ncbi:MAG: hypothetical protein ACYCX4_16155 [Bacillota bacterium]
MKTSTGERGSGQDQAIKRSKATRGNPVDAPLPRLRLSCKERSGIKKGKK